MKCFILLLLLVSMSGCAMLDQMVKHADPKAKIAEGFEIDQEVKDDLHFERESTTIKVTWSVVH